jgi:phospholipase C
MRTILGLFMLAVFLKVQAVAAPPEPKPGLQRVGHIIIIFLENRSFDYAAMGRRWPGKAGAIRSRE